MMSTKNRPLRRLGLVTMAAAFLVASMTKVQAAQLTSITYSPNPIILGGGVTYTANDDGTWPIASYKWEYRGMGPNGPCNWVTASSTSKTFFIYESYPGNWEVRCTATFRQISPSPPPPPSSITITVTISPANADKVVSGLNTPTNCGSQQDGVPPSKLPVVFDILVGSTPVGPYISGTLQERIRRPQYNFDSGWTNGNQDLYIRGGQVFDNKTVTIAPPDNLNSYNRLPNGYIIDDFYQQFRIVTLGSCNN